VIHISQESVFNLLRNHKNKEFTAKEIGKAVQIGHGAASINLKKLTSSRFIKCNYNAVPRVYWYEE